MFDSNYLAFSKYQTKIIFVHFLMVNWQLSCIYMIKYPFKRFKFYNYFEKAYQTHEQRLYALDLGRRLIGDINTGFSNGVACESNFKLAEVRNNENSKCELCVGGQL